MHYLVECSSPSNIAFIKYWGKLPGQIPLNPSLSMTLDHCRSTTSVEIIPAEFSVEYIFDGQVKDDFKLKIEKYLLSLLTTLSWIKEHKFVIHSSNNFPHSAGIASSASFFASLAHCLVNIDHKISNSTQIDLNFASKLARLGSGSAARSIAGPFTSWGSDTSDFASPVSVHPMFEQLHDTIVVVDDSRKSVSSSEGHKLMQEHVFKSARITQAQQNFTKISQALIEGDFQQFGEIVISEAMTLHALMMTSTPSYNLLKPNTLALIDILKLQTLQRQICYTLDAGPNLHIIYPPSEKEFVGKLLNQNQQFFLHKIDDRAGIGSVLVREQLC